MRERPPLFREKGENHFRSTVLSKIVASTKLDQWYRITDLEGNSIDVLVMDHGGGIFALTAEYYGGLTNMGVAIGASFRKEGRVLTYSVATATLPNQISTNDVETLIPGSCDPKVILAATENLNWYLRQTAEHGMLVHKSSDRGGPAL